MMHVFVLTTHFAIGHLVMERDRVGQSLVSTANWAWGFISKEEGAKV